MLSSTSFSLNADVFLPPFPRSVPTWPIYGTARSMLQFSPQESGVTQVIADTYRQAGMELLRNATWTENIDI